MKIKKHHSKYLVNNIFLCVFWASLVSIIIFLLLFRLDNWPRVWWDEGWTLDAARNWIEHDHLGHYLDGIPIPPRIPVRFPVVLPVTLSMRIFGVGIWQGRLPGVVFTSLSLALTVFLSSKMYNRRVGLASLLVLLFFSPYFFHPIIMGRQVLAEIPMMFYLLAGYSLTWLALTRSSIWVIGSILLFGVAIHAKLQVPPFWLSSFVLMIWIAISLRQRRSLFILTGISLGSIVTAGVVYWIQNMVMPGSFEDPDLIKLLINTVVIVINWRIRFIAILICLLFALPQFLSYIWSGRLIFPLLWKNRNGSYKSIDSNSANKEIIRMGVWSLGVSWFLWYLVLGLSWERYVFPAFFIGCIFVAAYLEELTNGFNISLVVGRISGILLHRNFNRQNFITLTTLVILCITLGLVGASMRGGFVGSNVNPVAAAAYLKNNIPTGARIETFESEILFLTPDVIFHFPSDLVSMQLNRKSSIDPRVAIDYDPIKTNPDYLLDGPMSKMWHLYDDVIDKGFFQLDADIDGYQIYQRRAISNNK
jgi:Dolichyl-phosphate-mannose-protein mannosyltransferase